MKKTLKDFLNQYQESGKAIPRIPKGVSSTGADPIPEGYTVKGSFGKFFAYDPNGKEIGKFERKGYAINACSRHQHENAKKQNKK